MMGKDSNDVESPSANPTDAKCNPFAELNEETIENSSLIIIEEIENNLIVHIKEHLAGYCFGPKTAAEDADFYSFDNTLEEFLKRYNSKDKSTKLGMAGELTAHILMPHLYTDLVCTAIFFNKEERSIKKGFDLAFCSKEGSALWYGEVKSGEVGVLADPSAKAVSLIDTAANSLLEMLSDGTMRSRWDSAITDTGLALEAGTAKTVKSLLRSDSQTINNNKSIEMNGILIGTVVHPTSPVVIKPGKAKEIAENIESRNKFNKIRILAIQQNAIDTIINELQKGTDE